MITPLADSDSESRPVRPWHIWAALCALTGVFLFLMLFHQSDTPAILGRYSLTYGIQLAVMLGLIVTFGILSLLAARGVSVPLVRFVARGRGAVLTTALVGVVGLTAYWIFLPGGRSQPGVMLFAVYSTSLLFAGWLWILHVSGANTMFISATGRWLTLVGGVITAAITLLTLGRVPPSLFLDEAWVANWGISLYTLRRPVITLMPDMGPSLTMRAPLFFIGLGAWLLSFGVTLQMGRLYWVVLIWACLPVLYKASQSLYGASIGGLTCIMAAILLPPHVYIRMDTVVIFFMMIGLWALMRAEDTGRTLWYGIAGFAFGLMFEGHQFPIFYDAAFGLMFAFDYVRVIRREKRWVWYAPFWAFVVGGLSGTAFYLFLHTIPWGIGPLAWLQDVLVAYGHEQTLGQISVTQRISTLTQYWILDYLLYHPIESALFYVGIAWALLRGHTRIQRLAVILLIAQIGMFLVLPKRSFFYYVFNLPFTALFVAGLLADLTGGWQERRLSLARASAFMAIGALLLTQIVLTAQASQNADAMIALSYQINADLPPQIEHVAAWQGYYFGFSGRQFLNSEILYRLKGKTLADLYWPTKPPQALLITLGLDDMKTELFDVIDQSGFVRVHCYPLDIFGRRADLYLRPEDDPYGGVTNCPK